MKRLTMAFVEGDESVAQIASNGQKMRVCGCGGMSERERALKNTIVHHDTGLGGVPGLSIEGH